MQFAFMHNTVHVDEKCFYLTRKLTSFNLAKDEPEPITSGKLQRYILKVMFICAVARSRFGINGLCVFDGKLRYGPFLNLFLQKTRRGIDL